MKYEIFGIQGFAISRSFDLIISFLPILSSIYLLIQVGPWYAPVNYLQDFDKQREKLQLKKRRLYQTGKSTATYEGLFSTILKI